MLWESFREGIPSIAELIKEGDPLAHRNIGILQILQRPQLLA